MPADGALDAFRTRADRRATRRAPPGARPVDAVVASALGRASGREAGTVERVRERTDTNSSPARVGAPPVMARPPEPRREPQDSEHRP